MRLLRSNYRNSVLSSSFWRTTKSYKTMTQKMTQYKYYQKNNSCKDVLQLVQLDSKPFGSISEKIIREIFDIGERSSSQNDGVFNGRKVEIKCARYWAGKDDCMWQHLEPEHDYEYVIFGLLDFHGWKVWSIKKDLLMGEMREKKIVTYQGKQGWWTRKSSILPYLTPIDSKEDLMNYVK